MINIILLTFGIILLTVGVRILLVVNHERKNKASDVIGKHSGIFIEHGMVRATDRIGVQADKKLSDVYCNSVI